MKCYHRKLSVTCDVGFTVADDTNVARSRHKSSHSFHPFETNPPSKDFQIACLGAIGHHGREAKKKTVDPRIGEKYAPTKQICTLSPKSSSIPRRATRRDSRRAVYIYTDIYKNDDDDVTNVLHCTRRITEASTQGARLSMFPEACPKTFSRPPTDRIPSLRTSLNLVFFFVT